MRSFADRQSVRARAFLLRDNMAEKSAVRRVTLPENVSGRRERVEATAQLRTDALADAQDLSERLLTSWAMRGVAPSISAWLQSDALADAQDFPSNLTPRKL